MFNSATAATRVVLVQRSLITAALLLQVGEYQGAYKVSSSAVLAGHCAAACNAYSRV
jgi:hypothetical protein